MANQLRAIPEAAQLYCTDAEMNNGTGFWAALDTFTSSTVLHPGAWASARGPMHGSVRAVSQGNRPRWYDGVLDAALDWCWTRPE